jgi:hypothetical protein
MRKIKTLQRILWLRIFREPNFLVEFLSIFKNKALLKSLCRSSVCRISQPPLNLGGICTLVWVLKINFTIWDLALESCLD